MAWAVLCEPCPWLGQYRSLNREYEREIDALEKERLELMAELRLASLHQGADALNIGLSTDQ